MLNFASRNAVPTASSSTIQLQGPPVSAAHHELPACHASVSMTAVGATPDETMSASESSCNPIGEDWWSSRAVKPSKKSKTAASTSSQKARCRSPSVSIATVAIIPQSRFESVSRLGMVKSLIFIFVPDN